METGVGTEEAHEEIMTTRRIMTLPKGMLGTEKFDPTRRYRYVLTRQWDGRPYACFIGMNPSKATKDEDDLTVRRCWGFAQDWNYGGLLMLNLFAFVTPYIPELFAARKGGIDIVGGDQNSFEALDKYIADYKAKLVVAAWGVDANDRGFAARDALQADLYVLARNKGGSPKHPSRSRGDLKPIPWK